MVFAGIDNTTSTPIWVEEGCGEPQSGGQRLCQHCKQPNDIHWCYFQLHIPLKAATAMAKLISQLCGVLQLAVCLSRGDVAI